MVAAATTAIATPTTTTTSPRMKLASTVKHYNMLEKASCCRLFNTKYLALLSAIYTLVS